MILTSQLDHLCYCASNLAYLVDGKGHFLPNVYPNHYRNNPYLKYVSGYSKVQAFSNEKGWIVDKINAAILIEYPTFNVLAFRGTLSSRNCASLQDWINDLNVAPTIVRGYDGAVHTGIYKAYLTLKTDIFEALEKQKDKSKPIIVTGHSKGGPMTSYAAFDLIQAGHKLIHVATIASPRPGDSAFAKSYTDLLTSKGLKQIRYENDLDIIPLLPPEPGRLDEYGFFLILLGILFDISDHPVIGTIIDLFGAILEDASSWDYAPVGKLQYITKDHNVVGESAHLWDQRLTQFENNFKNHLLDPMKAVENIFAAHGISIGHGYQKGIFPTFGTNVLSDF